MKTNKLNIVLDTNVFLVSILPHHKYFWIFDALQKNNFNLLVTNEILTEYQEILASKYGIKQTDVSLDFLLLLPNVKLIIPYFQWNLIEIDPDDNKFVDCALLGNADFIITHDKHFNVLKDIPFPKVNVIKIPDFEVVLNSNNIP
jgi:uncharacterized protein